MSEMSVNYNKKAAEESVSFVMTGLDCNVGKLPWNGMCPNYDGEGVHRLYAQLRVDRKIKEKLQKVEVNWVKPV